MGSTHTLVLRGNGYGTFAAPIDIAAAPSKMLVGDFTGDGKLDIVYTVSIGPKEFRLKS